jgi:hypothetical protein
MRFISFFSVFLLSASALFSSLSLYNDSPFTLRVKVIGADGSFIGEQTISPHMQSYMEDQIGISDPVGSAPDCPELEQGSSSVTPYQVFWHCPEGALYSSCLNASAGATVTANTCSGSYSCQEQEKKSHPQTSPDAYKQD